MIAEVKRISTIVGKMRDPDRTKRVVVKLTPWQSGAQINLSVRLPKEF